MSAFCMVKDGCKDAYFVINDCCYHFTKRDGVIPFNISQMANYHLSYVSHASNAVPQLKKMGFEKHSVSLLGDAKFFSNVKPCVDVSASTGKRDNQQIPIPVEDVPIGARITGIENDDGEIDEFSFPVQRIEVSDGFITFLHYWPSKQRTYSYEVSIKLGTRVTYTIK